MSIPDAQIFPHATGAAGPTVDQHQTPQDLIFHAGWFCPFVQRVWIALEERGIPYEYKEVNPYKKEPRFLELNPKGLVPAFEYRGQALYESLIMCEFLEDAFPSHRPALLPADPVLRGRVRIWADFVNKTISTSFTRTLMAQDPAAQAASLQELYTGIRTFVAEVKGPYFLGDEFSLADVAIAPWIVRDYILQEHRGYDRAAVGVDWTEYADRIVARESITKTTSEKDKMEGIWGRYLRDEAMSEGTKAIRAGRPF
ncbi:glutathione-S-transferase [Epithele typhae]|uniref:glutathione-S-transferase n=1 Tax=Epithele typhae TaxID=378194 RepID=UPI002008B2A3|nr:glutathione-S-transferase [Epithele typhae]KAH9923727.1 glutathione-S-transferase [Epithele typhae]